MKTTFKKAFDEFDDELMNIDEFNACENIDIDVEKIKGRVLMRINDKNDKKKSGKKIIPILVAAAIVIAGTVGTFATGSVQSMFKELFNNNSVNSAGLYDGGNVELISCDDSLNVELLGITGDGEKLYSAIEVTKKDGSPIIDEDYDYPYFCVYEHPDQIPEGKTIDDYYACRAVYVDKSGNSSREKEGNLRTINSVKYSISEDNKSLKIFVFSRISEGDLQNGRVTVTSEGFGANSNHYFELPFEISFDLNYDIDGNISKELTVENAPNLIEPAADKVKMEITPFAVYLYGQCDKETVEKSGWSEQEEIHHNHCFKDIGWTENSKIILNDGTVYYLYPDEGYNYGVGEDGNADYYEEKVPLNLSTVVGPPIEPQINVIDTREIKTVMINGDTVYSK